MQATCHSREIHDPFLQTYSVYWQNTVANTIVANPRPGNQMLHLPHNLAKSPPESKVEATSNRIEPMADQANPVSAHKLPIQPILTL